jgi:hypothetical protein
MSSQLTRGTCRHMYLSPRTEPARCLTWAVLPLREGPFSHNFHMWSFLTNCWRRRSFHQKFLAKGDKECKMYEMVMMASSVLTNASPS